MGTRPATLLQPINVTMFMLNGFIFTLNSQFPPLAVAKSTITEPGYICSTVFFESSVGAFYQDKRGANNKI